MTTSSNYPLVVLIGIIFLSALNTVELTALTSRQNFTHLGYQELRGETNGARGITYFFSEYKLSHSDALLECRNVFFGRLLTIYTVEQNEYIRIRLQHLNLDREQIHTAGRYNADATNPDWEWATTSTPCYYKQWRPQEPSIEEAGYCIDLLGASSAYGWVSRACTNPHLFICEMLI